MRVHFLVPDGFTRRASGGNVYDRQLRRELLARGLEVCTHQVRPGGAIGVPSGLTLVDSQVASWSPASFHGAVPLMHMLFDVAGEQELLRAAPAVVTTSNHLRNQLLSSGLVADRVQVAVPGVVPAPLVAGSASGAHLLCVATVTPAKGQDVLLAALARLTDLDWSLTLVGHWADAGFADTLRRRAAGDRVRLVGELTGPDLDHAWEAADLLVLPSHAESYGMVVTEALARGLPVVASAVGGVPEALGTVEGGRPGLLVPPGDVAALATALRGWLEDPVLRAELRSAARRRRRTLPAWSDTADAVAKALTSVSLRVSPPGARPQTAANASTGVR